MKIILIGKVQDTKKYTLLLIDNVYYIIYAYEYSIILQK